MSLRNPWWLALLIPTLAWLALAIFPRAAAGLSPLRRLRFAGAGWRIRLWWLPEVFLFLFFALGVVLLSGPERELDGKGDSGDGLAIALTLDRSGSLAAIIPFQGKDVPRLDAVKAVTREFLSERPRDQFALVSFARYPETNSPLTGNHQVVADFLDLLSVPGKPEEDGTAIGDALVLASARLARQKVKGVIILLTDGQNNQGQKSPEEGAAAAAGAGFPIYCIALGGDGYVVQDTTAGKIAQTVPEAIDEDTLNAIAAQTGGRYYHALGPDDLQGFYADIARRETSKLEQSRPRETELILAPGLAGLLFLLAASLASRHLLLRRMDP